MASLVCARISPSPVRLINRKRQDIGGAPLAAIHAIPPSDFGVRDQADGDGFGGQAERAASAGDEFCQISDGNADIALAIQDHVSRCRAPIERVRPTSVCRARCRTLRDVIATSIARHLPRAFFAARPLGFERAAGARL